MRTVQIAAIVFLSVIFGPAQSTAPRYHSTCCNPLPPEKVTKLPAEIRTHLAEEHCLIPQDPNVRDDPQPNNAIPAPWASSAHRDWSVLCLKPLELTIRIFWTAKEECPDTIVLAKFPPNDGHWEDPETFLWPADPAKIRAYNQAFAGRELPPLDHSGLEVGGEEASTIYYCYKGTWLTFSGND
ncbi:MAG TPA: hypothetical protein VN911_03705 [Candidatus Acidoferrum sp.]|nr:hypothetical protein [Candidatus Acidoferrum sp.]